MIVTAGIIGSLAVFGSFGAGADWTEPNGGDEIIGADATTQSEVPTNLWCTWYINGLDASITLASPNGGTDEYEGEELLLTGTQADQEVLVAGYTAGESPAIADREPVGDADPYDCSWYNSEQGVKVTVTSAGAGFSAVAALGGDDLEMGWTLAEEPIAVTYTADPDGSCSGWTVASALDITGDGASIDAAVFPYASVTETEEDCSWSSTFAVSMPAGMMPTYPGQNYTFTGPTLETSVAFLVPAL
jgi:hypothetical protein